MTITIYGIKNCDTMKKARAWLDSHGVAYDFHDYKTAGIAKDKLKQWSGRGRLGDAAQPRRHDLQQTAGCATRKGSNERKALALMLAQPSMIKRPVLDLGGKLLVGFKPEIYAKEVATKSDQARQIVGRAFARRTDDIASMNELAEFEHVAGRECGPGARWNRSRSIMVRSFGTGSCVVAAHQVLDLEAAVLADRLQRRDDMADVAVVENGSSSRS